MAFDRLLDGKPKRRERGHSSTKPATFSTTVAQKTARNSCLADLCRSHCCASSAPGQPQASDNRCSVDSAVRQRQRHNVDQLTTLTRISVDFFASSS